MKRLLASSAAFALALTAGAPASAQPAAPPLTVELAPDPFPLGDVAMRAAVGTELGVPTRASADATADDAAAGGLGVVTITLEAGRRARISYRPRAADPAGTISRTVDLPARPEDALQLIALIAGNLVRDQAGPLIAELSLQIQVDTVPPVPETTPAATTPPSSASASPVSTASTAPPDATAPPSREILFTLGFVPPLATDRLWTREPGEELVVGAGLHILVGVTDGLRGVSVSGVADVQRRFTHGLQVGGVATISGGELVGVQVAGAVAVADRSRGAQIAGSAALARSVEDGVQIAAGATLASSLSGAQIAGAVAAASHVSGVQIAGGAAIGGDVVGLQLAPINVARRIRGVQLGVINVSDEMDGVPIGLISIVRHGRLELDGWAESSRFAAVALRHGPRRFHNIYAVGFPDADPTATPFLGLGLGIHRPLAHRDVDVDAMVWNTDVSGDKVGLLTQLRASVAIHAGPFALLFGAAANCHIRDTADTIDLHPVLDRTYQSGDVAVTIWPTIFAGIRRR